MNLAFACEVTVTVEFLKDSPHQMITVITHRKIDGTVVKPRSVFGFLTRLISSDGATGGEGTTGEPDVLFSRQ
jgi:hypothetical protein